LLGFLFLNTRDFVFANDYRTLNTDQHKTTIFILAFLEL